MLRILRGGFFSVGREKLTEEIKLAVNERKPTLLIVPEQQTVLSETELASMLPSYSPLCFEVTNFSRLANTTFRALGGINGEYCDKTVKALIMWRTLTELSPMLNMTSGKREITAGLVESALMAIGEMQSLSITAEMLEAGAKNEKIKENKRLSGKLTDLSKIYTLYKSLLSERFSDTSEDTAEMIKRLEENPNFLAGHRIYLEGFTSFTEPQYRLIEILSKRAELTVLLTISRKERDFFEFTEIKDTEERLISDARRSSVHTKLIDIEELRLDKKESIRLVVNSLWRKQRVYDNVSLQNKDEIRIFEAVTPFDECSFVASDIKRRVMEGASFRDFAIIMRSESSYRGILDGALKLADLPYFTSTSKDADTYEIIKLIYAAYAIVRSEFVKEDVLTYAKCGLSGISRVECDELESYIDTWQISGKRFTDDTVWNMNPDGFSSRRSPKAAEKLRRIHDIRTRLISPLHRLAEETSRASTIREQAFVLVNFLTSIKAEEGLRERAALLSSLGETALAEENLRLWRLIIDSLDTLVSLSGDTECTTDGFVGQLKILFSSVEVRRIPAHYDEITVGTADMLRLTSKKHIYLIGVNAGVFPMAPKDSAFFTEKDKLILSECNMSIKPVLAIDEARELYFFSRAISYADESVTLLYTALNTRYKSVEPSEVIAKIGEITYGDVKARRIAVMEARDRLYDKIDALNYDGDSSRSTVRQALIDSGLGDELLVSESSITNEAMSLGEEYKSNASGSNLSLSQTKIDTYVNCPLSYFCKYTVSLEKEKLAEFDASGIGTLIHAILENFFAELKKSGEGAGSISPERRIELTRRAAEMYIRELGDELDTSSVRTRIKIDRLCRAALPVVEGLCDEFASSEFTPKFFELAISEGNESAPDPIRFTTKEGNGVVIGGIIDRVDTYEKDGDVYVRVVDYKTGKKVFTPEDIKEGKNLQMFLYLHSLVSCKKQGFLDSLGVGENGRAIPSGVIYVKTFIGDKTVELPSDDLAVTAVKKAQKRLGMILDDPYIIKAMDMKYTPLYDERAKDKNKIPDAKKKLLFTEDQFAEIMVTVEDSCCRVADGIAAGKIDAAPRVESDSSPCDFCEYKPLCRRIIKGKRF